MKKVNKINPIAKSLREPNYRSKLVPDKRRQKKDKQADKEVRDAKTQQDTWTNKNLQPVDDCQSVWTVTGILAHDDKV